MISKRAIRHAREILAPHSTRPLGVFLFTVPEYPETTTEYKVTLTRTQIGIYVDSRPFFLVDYVDKSAKEIASELNNSPFPVDVKVLVDVPFLKEGEILASGALIPTGFADLDRGQDGKSAIIRVNRWAVRYNKQTTVEIKAPYNTGSVQPWYARVSNGEFSNLSNSIIYYFGVPEYKEQPWSVRFGYPFVDVEGEVANFIGEKKIKTVRHPIHWKGNNIAITDNSGRKVFPSSIIKDVDTINGIVYIQDGATVPDNALIYYTYLERNLVYRNLNLNCHFSQNPSLLDQYVVFYALPIKSTNGESRERGIYHSVGNSVPEAINNIVDVSMAEPLSILGAIHMSADIDYEEANVIDSRSYGGGLTEDVRGKAAEQKFPQTQYFNDLSTYDGIPYHGSAAVVVELPEEITSVMTLEELRKATQKFVAAGVYVIIDYSNSRDMWAPSSESPDISFVQHDTQKRKPTSRTNWHSNTEAYFDQYDAIRLDVGSTWTYQTYRSTETTHGHPVEYRIYEDQERADGLTGAWKFQVATGQITPIFGYMAAAGHGFMYSKDQTDLGISEVWDATTPYIDREAVGYMSQHQTVSYEVKQPSSGEFEYSTISIKDRGVEYPEPKPRQYTWEASWRWEDGVPVWESGSISSDLKTIPADRDDTFVYFVRDGWYRLGLSINFPSSEYYDFPSFGHQLIATGVKEGALRVIFQRPYGNDPSGNASDYVGSGMMMGRSHFAPVAKEEARRMWLNYQHINGFFDIRIKEEDTNYLTLIDSEAKKLVGTGLSLGWINADMRIPEDLLTGDGRFFPYVLPDASSNRNIDLESGTSYYMKYLKGAPNTHFFWEEQEEDGRWVNLQHIDRRKIQDKTLTAGRIVFSSRSAKTIRNFSGSSLYRTQNIDDFVDEIIPEIEQIYQDMDALGFKSSVGNPRYSFSTGLITNISDGTIEIVNNLVSPITEPLYAAFLRGYQHIISVDYRSAHNSGDFIPEKRGLLFSDAVLDSAKHYPNIYNIDDEDFDAYQTGHLEYMHELQLYADYASNRLTDFRANGGVGTPSVVELDIQSLITGAFLLGTKLEVASSGGLGYDIGEDIRSPLYDADRDEEKKLSGDYAEMDESISDMYLSTDYIPAYAALYAVQERPTNTDYAHAWSLQVDISPRDIAISGIHSALHHFERYYDFPRFSGEFQELNWFYTYNRHGNLAGRLLKNVSTAFDYLYYGNTEWAGLNPAVTNSPWHDSIFDDEFINDMAFTRDAFCLPAFDNVVLSGHFPIMLDSYTIITEKLRSLLEANMLRGGITTPEMIDLIRGYLWIPYNAALGETMFQNVFNEEDVKTFELCMASILKGSITEDGFIFQSTQFKHDPVGQPSFPVEIMKASVDAVKYYRATGDAYNEARWVSTLQGLWHTATGLYKDSYGYPTTISFDGTGDTGVDLLEAALPIISLRTSAYTAVEIDALTGQITSRI